MSLFSIGGDSETHPRILARRDLSCLSRNASCRCILPASHLSLQPQPYGAKHMRLFRIRQGVLSCDPVPLRQTLTATGSGGVLGDKDGMTTHGSLLPIVGGVVGEKSCRQEPARVVHNDVQPLRGEVGEVFFVQPEAAAKFGPRQRIEQTSIFRGHGHPPFHRTRHIVSLVDNLPSVARCCPIDLVKRCRKGFPLMEAHDRFRGFWRQGCQMGVSSQIGR